MEKIKGQIYVHTNKITGKHYVGQTIDETVVRRWRNNGEGYNKTTRFGRAIKKYGWDSFEHVILPEVYETHEDLDKAEIEAIKLYDSYKNGYNSTLGGNGSSGYAHKDSTKNKISQALKGRPSPHKGKHMSEETKEKLRQAHTGKKLSEETIEKLRQAHIGKKLSEETKAKLRRAMTGIKRSEETIEKMRQANIGRHRGREPWNKGKRGLKRI